VQEQAPSSPEVALYISDPWFSIYSCSRRSRSASPREATPLKMWIPCMAAKYGPTILFMPNNTMCVLFILLMLGRLEPCRAPPVGAVGGWAPFAGHGWGPEALWARADPTPVIPIYLLAHRMKHRQRPIRKSVTCASGFGGRVGLVV
jgi:hypothetical protein